MGLKKVGNNAEKIKEFLYSINGKNSYHGITGITAFDSFGEVNKSFSIYVVKNNKFIIY